MTMGPSFVFGFRSIGADELVSGFDSETFLDLSNRTLDWACFDKKALKAETLFDLMMNETFFLSYQKEKPHT